MTETKNLSFQLKVETDYQHDAEHVALELTNWFMDAIYKRQECKEYCKSLHESEKNQGSIQSCDLELIDLKPFNEEEEN